jgi:hypothetical protein
MSVAAVTLTGIGFRVDRDNEPHGRSQVFYFYYKVSGYVTQEEE